MMFVWDAVLAALAVLYCPSSIAMLVIGYIYYSIIVGTPTHVFCSPCCAGPMLENLTQPKVGGFKRRKKTLFFHVVVLVRSCFSGPFGVSKGYGRTFFSMSFCFVCLVVVCPSLGFQRKT